MLKTATQKARQFFEQPLTRALGAAAELFKNQDQLDDDEMRVMALIKAVLPPDQPVAKQLAKFRSQLELQNISERKIGYIMDFLEQAAPGTPEAALPVLKTYSQSRQQNLLSSLLTLSLEHGEYRSESLDFVRQLALALDISEEDFQALADQIKNSCNSRAKIIKSSTGIILALIVIALFIMIATWLSSLLFGLALAYMFLPLEQYFERKLKSPPGFFYRAIGKKRLKRKSRFKLSAEELKRREQSSIITRATTLTVSCVVAGGVAIILAVILAANLYLNSRKSDSAAAAAAQTSQSAQLAQVEKTGVSAQPATEAQTPAARSVPENILTDVSNNLASFMSSLQKRFRELPLVQNILNELSDYLTNGKAQQQLAELLLKKSGGIFAFLANFVALFATFLLNILLTFFFFSLLLSKLAAFINNSGRAQEQSTSYLIRTVFNGKWLPAMSEENLQQGDRIVSEVINKLRIWLRGYLTMILIDFCVYSIIFTLLDVPYAILLGAIAGVGILLPYIGPVTSALLTVLVTLAVGGADTSVYQIAGIIGAYLIHNGVIEQFFIYPWIIGESLGLTTLETIIVVLLGGIMAGIPGMIFALPAASVIKYLVPQIYRCWK